MYDTEAKVAEAERDLARIQENLRTLREELARERQVSKYDRYVGKLCMFWDQVDSITELPVRGMVRPFHHVVREQSSGRGELRFYAGDWYSGEEIGHGWKHMRPFGRTDLHGLLAETTDDVDTRDCHR